MQKRSEADKTGRGQWVYPENEAAYWQEQHSKQPYAKNSSYKQYEHAYRTGYTVRPAVTSVWDRITGVITPRDRDRGMRDSI